jgi:hypothetical protein
VRDEKPRVKKITEEQKGNASMKKLMGFAMILVISGNALAGTVPAKGNNATIVIGKSIGSVPWPRNSTDLIHSFGSAKVNETKVPMGEGGFVKGSVVFPKDKDKEIQIVWGSSGIERMIVRSAFWKFGTGVRVGATLKDVQSLNGRPFKLYGLGWDYGGTTSAWEGGSLDGPFEKSEGYRALLRFEGQRNKMKKLRKILGETLFSSDHAEFQTLNPLVYEILVISKSP